MHARPNLLPHRSYNVAVALTSATVGLLMPRSASAHFGPTHRRVTWDDWNWDLVILLIFAWIAAVYANGIFRLWRRAGPGAVVGLWQVACFVFGGIVLLAAIVSPLDPMSDQLSAAHMVQHMLIMTVAAPLIIAGAPAYVLLWGMSPDSRKLFHRRWKSTAVGSAASRFTRHPIAAWCLFAAAMWLWHLPASYQAALLTPWVHDLQHVSFFAAACIFWRAILDPPRKPPLSAGLAAVYLFTTTMHSTILGVLMTLATEPWYVGYGNRPTLWGLSNLEDQQLAGLIMWMPACAGYLIATIIVTAKAITEFDAAPTPREKRQCAATAAAPVTRLSPIAVTSLPGTEQ